MTRRAATLWAAAATFSLSVGPALAAQAKERPDSRPATGTRRDRGLAPVRRRGRRIVVQWRVRRILNRSGSSSSGGGSASSMPSGGGSHARSDDGSRRSAPERRDERAASRDDQSRREPGLARSGNSVGAVWRQLRDQRRAVPAYSRPRDGRTTIGYAVEGERPPYGGNGNGNIIYYPYYDPFYGYGYGYGSRYGYTAITVRGSRATDSASATSTIRSATAATTRPTILDYGYRHHGYGRCALRGLRHRRPRSVSSG